MWHHVIYVCLIYTFLVLGELVLLTQHTCVSQSQPYPVLDAQSSWQHQPRARGMSLRCWFYGWFGCMEYQHHLLELGSSSNHHRSDYQMFLFHLQFGKSVCLCCFPPHWALLWCLAVHYVFVNIFKVWEKMALTCLPVFFVWWCGHPPPPPPPVVYYDNGNQYHA